STAFIKALGTGAIASLGTAQIVGLSSAQLAAWSSSDQIRALETQDVAQLTTGQVKALSTAQISALSTGQLAALSSVVVPVLSTAAVVALDTASIAALTTAQVKVLTTAQIRAISDQQLAALQTEDVATLSSAQIAALSTASLSGLTTDQVVALTPANTVGLSTAQLRALSSTQIAAFQTADFAVLGTAQLAGLGATQGPGLNASLLGTLDATEIGKLATAFVQNLNTTVISAFTSTQVAALTTTQIKNLTVAQHAALNSSHLGSLQTAAFTSMASPLVLDLNGDGVRTVAVAGGVSFALGADGLLRQTGWVSPEDGLLVRDLNGDGIINNGRELFGTATELNAGVTAIDGFAALSDLDSNGDGRITAQDAAFSELAVWKDADGNGQTGTGELVSLTQAGVAALHLDAKASAETDNGNLLGLVSSYETTDGQQRDLVDVWFRQGAVVDDSLRTAVSSLTESLGGYLENGTAMTATAGLDFVPQQGLTLAPALAVGDEALPATEANLLTPLSDYYRRSVAAVAPSLEVGASLPGLGASGTTIQQTLPASLAIVPTEILQGK
ncbi:hypothetical protein ACFO6X_00390, partial [Giesbergeria sinuosa]